MKRGAVKNKSLSDFIQKLALAIQGPVFSAAFNVLEREWFKTEAWDSTLPGLATFVKTRPEHHASWLSGILLGIDLAKISEEPGWVEKLNKRMDDDCEPCVNPNCPMHGDGIPEIDPNATNDEDPGKPVLVIGREKSV